MLRKSCCFFCFPSLYILQRRQIFFKCLYVFSVHISCGQIFRQAIYTAFSRLHFSSWSCRGKKDETTRLAEAAIKIITGQVKVPGNSMILLQDPMKMNSHGTIETINGMIGEMSVSCLTALMIQGYSCQQYY